MGKYDFITINFAGLLGILFLLVFLKYNSRIERSIRRKFFVLILFELVEMAVFSAELVTDTYSHFTMWRVFYSVVGYVVRPLLLYIVLIISLRDDDGHRKERFLAIPLVINLCISSTAFFSDISFGYTQQNIFYRGPLAYSSHVAIIFYLLALIISNVKESATRKRFERMIIYLMCGVISASLLIETVFFVRNIGRTALVMCTIFYFMFFQNGEYDRTIDHERKQLKGLATMVKLDSMTRLLNKETFEKYCVESLETNIEGSIALFFIDLDHFKQVNDTLGHLEGDKAIVDAAAHIKKIYRSIDFVSRFGGDEFCVCMRNVPFREMEDRLKLTCDLLRHEYWNEDHTVSIKVTCSIGAVYYQNIRNLDYNVLIQKADEAVYEAKSSGRDQYVIRLD